MADLTKPKKQISVWWFAFGYFAVYIPYSFFTKMVTGGLLAKDMPQDQIDACLQKADTCNPDVLAAIEAVKVNSFEWLPPTIIASILSMLIFISCVGWWKYATHTTKVKIAGRSLPRPRIWTLFSGICTGLVVVTTTLAYTIDGVSIVFAMLFMRGGMLIMSPIVDTIFKRHVRWFSWAALGMSILALVISNFGPYALGFKTFGEQALMNAMLAIDLIVYLSAYFFRLSFMSKLAKSENDDDTKKFFVEEQMVGTPSIFIILLIASFFAPDVLTADSTGLQKMLFGIHAGFTTFWSRPGVIIALAFGAGLFSQFNGVFGSLILLDKSENAFAVAINRCSSILAGTIASILVAVIFTAELNGKPLMPDVFQFVGAAFVIGALLFLTLPKLIAKSKAKKAAELAGNKAEEKADDAKAEEKADDAKGEEKAADAKAE
ncbi:MAG: hypothetical protein IKY83_05150, partial [Proteobacteria bacterium]|nr:hypothetical protein [Pseudomonadota bacterium]